MTISGELKFEPIEIPAPSAPQFQPTVPDATKQKLSTIPITPLFLPKYKPTQPDLILLLNLLITLNGEKLNPKKTLTVMSLLINTTRSVEFLK
jgi:hypothetical protein